VRRTGSPAAVLSIDLDRFKDVIASRIL